MKDDREMINDSHCDFRTAELNPELLSMPFKVQTNWHVITGAPCSGKSTLIDQLANRGFQTVPEPGRQYFEQELATGRTIEAIREDEVGCLNGIANLTIEIEHGLDANKVVFLDRGYPDALAFCRVNGLNPNEFLANCFHHRYASVFLLDRFPVEQDGVRAEDEATASFLDMWLARDYSALGYSIVRVPVISIKDRLAFILERLSDDGLI